MMNLDDVMSDDEPPSLAQSMGNVTVAELIQLHGEEAVRRGLSYMASLSEADENFRESGAEGADYGEEYIKAIAGEEANVDGEKAERLQSDWEEAMEGDGLGLDN